MSDDENDTRRTVLHGAGGGALAAPINAQWLSQPGERMTQLRAENEALKDAAIGLEELREELAIWRSVFPDIAPARVQPDRSLLEAEIERLRAENDALRCALASAQESSWEDRDDEWTAKIRAAHPVHTGDPEGFKNYDMALRMVGNRHSKYALVDLVAWLLSRRASND